MALYKECGHYDGLCPCFNCSDFKLDICKGCLDIRRKEYVVDTDELCIVAKEYCESGRDEWE